MKRLLFLAIAAAGVTFAQDCAFTGTFTSATAGSAQTNKATTTGGTPCIYWSVSYWTNGASGVSVKLEGAADVAGASSGSYTALTATTGANPMTGTAEGTAVLCCDFYPWLRINPTTFTGTSQTMTFRAYGWTAPPGNASSTPGSVTSIATGCGLTGGTITTTGTISESVTVNAQTGAGAYAIVNGDCGKLISRNQSAAVADTIAQAGSGGSFAAGWSTEYQCVGAGGCKITPATSTIDGAASINLLQNQGVKIVSDGTNYYTLRSKGAKFITTDPTGACTDATFFAINTATGKLTGCVNGAYANIPDGGATPTDPTASTTGNFWVVRTSVSTLTIGPSCAAIPNDCLLTYGALSYDLVTSPTAVIASGTTDTAYIYVDGSTVKVGTNTAGITCTGCTAVTGVTGFPANTIPLWTWTIVGGEWPAGGTGNVTYNVKGAGQVHTISFAIDSGSTVITTGDIGLYPANAKNNGNAGFSCTIKSYTLTGTPSGSITVDVWKKNGAVPTSADKISASAPMALSSSTFQGDGSLTGWKKDISPGDVFGFSVATAATTTKATGVIYCQ